MIFHCLRMARLFWTACEEALMYVHTTVGATCVATRASFHLSNWYVVVQLQQHRAQNELTSQIFT